MAIRASSLLGVGCWLGARVCCSAISLALITSADLSVWSLIALGQVDPAAAAGMGPLFGLGFLLQAEERRFGLYSVSLCVVLPRQRLGLFGSQDWSVLRCLSAKVRLLALAFLGSHSDLLSVTGRPLGFIHSFAIGEMGVGQQLSFAFRRKLVLLGQQLMQCDPCPERSITSYGGWSHGARSIGLA